MCNFAPMKIDFQYSTDFYGMNAKELSDTCMHLLCTAGEGSFVFNERLIVNVYCFVSTLQRYKPIIIVPTFSSKNP